MGVQILNRVCSRLPANPDFQDSKRRLVRNFYSPDQPQATGEFFEAVIRWRMRAFRFGSHGFLVSNH
jgi:hypothetical protein